MIKFIQWVGLALLSIGAVAGLTYVVISYRVVPAEKNGSLSADQSSVPAAQQTTTSSDDHHGASASVDSTIFNGLVGKTAPDFTLEKYDGATITLSSLRGKNVILFFNEGLMCYPACWNQIAAFGNAKEFDPATTVILNITTDPKRDWTSAVKKMPELAAATVLFDINRGISSAYGVLTLPSSMHRGQFPGHSYVIVDKNGVVQFVQDDVQMAVRNKELAEEVKKL